MSYSTPHHAHEFMKMACLRIVHDYILGCQRKSTLEKQKIVLLKREIDLTSRLALQFGPEAALAAQGTSALDLIISSPTIRAEVKFLRRKPGGKQPVNLWNSVKGPKKDWHWLLGLNNTGDNFKKHCLVFFLPSKAFLDFDQVCDVKPAGAAYTRSDYAPFVGLVRPSTKYPNKLIYKKQYPQDMLIRVGKKIVRRQVVGSTSHPIWALIFSRVGTKEYESLTRYREISI